MGLLEAELVCLTCIVIISLGCSLFKIGSQPQFYTLCLSPIRIIPLLSDAHKVSWLLCALLRGCPAPAATVLF